MKLTGNLVFEPDRGADFRKTGKLKTLILDLPGSKHRALAQYYTRLIEAEHGPWCNLMEPMFGTHITVVRGNGDRFHEDDCKRLVGQKVTVELDPTTLQRTPWSGKNPAFWFIKVISTELQVLRHIAHIKPIFSYDPHLTVAREGVDFFMHIKPQRDPLRLAKALIETIPTEAHRGRKKGEARQGGNQALRMELEDFVRGFKVNPLATADSLVKLVHNHVKIPTAAWQQDLLNLFKEQP